MVTFIRIIIFLLDLNPQSMLYLRDIEDQLFHNFHKFLLFLTKFISKFINLKRIRF